MQSSVHDDLCTDHVHPVHGIALLPACKANVCRSMIDVAYALHRLFDGDGVRHITDCVLHLAGLRPEKVYRRRIPPEDTNRLASFEQRLHERAVFIDPVGRHAATPVVGNHQATAGGVHRNVTRSAALGGLRVDLGESAIPGHPKGRHRIPIRPRRRVEVFFAGMLG